MTEETADIVFDSLFGIEKNSFKSKCFTPCTSVEYVVELKSKDAVPGDNAAVYIFAFVVDPFTLLNRLGGTIGICKEVL